MFTIEHEFDASVITLVDDAGTPGTEDVTISCFDDQVVLEQVDPHTDRVQRISLTLRQVNDLRAALDLPEGAYVRRPD
ncbi:MAG: hypothetical protein AAGB10_19160 [Pseudomonadota bacterium]